jgi:hypothetical protein
MPLLRVVMPAATDWAAPPACCVLVVVVRAPASQQARLEAPLERPVDLRRGSRRLREGEARGGSAPGAVQGAAGGRRAADAGGWGELRARTVLEDEAFRLPAARLCASTCCTGAASTSAPSGDAGEADFLALARAACWKTSVCPWPLVEAFCIEGACAGGAAVGGAVGARRQGRGHCPAGGPWRAGIWAAAPRHGRGRGISADGQPRRRPPARVTARCARRAGALLLGPPHAALLWRTFMPADDSTTRAPLASAQMLLAPMPTACASGP